MAIHSTAIVHSKAKIGSNVEIGPFATVGEASEINDNCSIGAHAIIGKWTTLGKGCRISSHAVVGAEPQDLKYNGEKTLLVVGENTVIREFATVHRGTKQKGKTVVGKDNFIMSYAHIAHDCSTGDNVIFANSATLAGHITIGDHAILGGLTAFHQFVKVGSYSIIGGGSGVSKDVPPFAMVAGFRAKIYGMNSVALKRHNFPPSSIKKLKSAFKYLFHSHLNTSQAIEAIRENISPCPELTGLIEFISSSKRGICK